MAGPQPTKPNNTKSLARPDGDSLDGEGEKKSSPRHLWRAARWTLLGTLLLSAGMLFTSASLSATALVGLIIGWFQSDWGLVEFVFVVSAAITTLLGLCAAFGWGWHKQLRRLGTVVGLLGAVGCALFLSQSSFWVVPLILLGAMILWPSSTPDPALEKKDFDAPIKGKAADVFARGGLVQQIVRFLTKDTMRCLRAAVTGPVGSGKTSVANLVAEALPDEYMIIRFDPWHYQDSATCRQALLANIEDRIATQKDSTLGYRLLRGRLLKVWHWLVGEYSWLGLINSDVQAKLELGQKELADAIRKTGKRLIVIVDDLERADPIVALDLLMHTKEIINTDGISYLFLFDEEGLIANINTKDPANLEKILDMRWRLGQPDSDGQNTLRERLLHELDSDLSPEDLDWMDELDLSPRQQQRFLLYLETAFPSPLPGLNRRYLGLLAMLEFEEAGALESIAQSKALIDDLDSGELHDVFRDAFKKVDPNGPQVQAKESPSSRFSGSKVYALARRSGGVSKDTVRHVNFLLGRELSAVQEMVYYWRHREGWNNWQSLEDINKALPDNLRSHPSRLLGAIGMVDLMLNMAAESVTGQDQNRIFERVKMLDQYQEQLIEEMLTRGEAADAETFKASYQLLLKWLRMRDRSYSDHNRCQILITKKLAKQVGVRQAFLCRDALREFNILEKLEPNPGNNRIRAKLDELLLPKIHGYLDRLIETPNAVSDLRSNWPRRHENQVLFNLNSGYYTDERKQRFLKLFQERDDLTENLVQFLLILTWHAKSQDVGAAEHREWLEALWTVLRDRPLNNLYAAELNNSIVSLGLGELSAPIKFEVNVSEEMITELFEEGSELSEREPSGGSGLDS